MRRPDNNQRGIAMMVVLWVLVLLIALATEFAFSMKTEVNTTRNFKEDIEAYHLAKAGIALAMTELITPVRFHSIHPEHGWIYAKPVIAQGDVTQRDPKTGGAVIKEFEIKKFEINDPNAPTEENAEKEYEVIERKDIPVGEGIVSYSITDENSRISINTASRGVLIKALEISGIEVGEERDIIADSILDWIDEDSNHRINGAENSYYEGLSPPYKAKNGRIETLEELLKVRGMTKEIFYGTSKEELTNPDAEPREPSKIRGGWQDLFTVYNTETVNPNTAGPRVLAILFGQKEFDDILKQKKEKGFYNESKSTHFRVQATGSFKDSQTRHSISVVLEKPGGDENAGLLTHYWNDNHIEP